jgi:glucan endo-1,3-beta-D-glucosidase
LIVPVDSSSPNKAYGTQYNATLSSTESTIFNFDIPSSYEGMTCSLLFLFPEKADLETTDFTFNGKGGITVEQLDTVATESTTYASAGSGNTVGSETAVTPGNSYTIMSTSCPAGTAVSYEFSATGGLELEWFNDWNPSPLGVFVRVC